MDDWRPGDLALCIRTHPLYPPEVQPGKLHTVEHVWDTVDAFNPDHRDLALDLLGVARMPGDLAYWSKNFIKVTPREPDEFDFEVITDLVCTPNPVFVSPDARMEASVTSRPVTPNRPGGNFLDLPRAHNNLPCGNAEGEGVDGGRA